MNTEKNTNKEKGNAVSPLVSNSTTLEKPTPEKYGWHEQQGFDDGCLKGVKKHIMKH